MTTEEPSPNPVPEANPAPDAPVTPAPVTSYETERTTVAPARRYTRSLGIVGAVLGAVLLLFVGFAVGHWAVGHGHHDGGQRVQRANRQGPQNSGRQPNAQSRGKLPSLNGALPDLAQLRALLQELLRNRALNGSNNAPGNRSPNSNGQSNSNNQLNQLQKEVQQLQNQVQQLQSQLKSSSTPQVTPTP
jgi:hypothetical protein